MDTLLADGKREEALETFIRQVVMMPEEELRVYRFTARLAGTYRRRTHDRREVHPSFDPAQAEKVTVPTLMLAGEDSPDSMKADYETVAAALPDVRIAILDGQQHIAMDLIPEVFAKHVVAFLRDDS